MEAATGPGRIVSANVASIVSMATPSSFALAQGRRGSNGSDFAGNSGIEGRPHPKTTQLRNGGQNVAAGRGVS